MTKYNYDGFSTKSFNLDTFKGPEVGSKAPDFELQTTEGDTVNLLDFKEDFLVLELGSITCPLFQGRREGMNTLVNEFQSVQFSVLYIREAHPGSHMPAHSSMEDKRGCATHLKVTHGESRQILIDGLEGKAHQSYGGYPNAVFVMNQNGCIVFRSDWNSVPATRKALKKLLNGQPAQTKSYFLPVKPSVTIRTLKQSGKGAFADFFKGLPQLIWKNLIRRNFLLLINQDKGIAPDASC